MSVDRCVCHNVTFATLLDLSRRVGPSLGALSAATGCGTSCGRCMPYILLTLKTGRTRWIPQDEAGLRRLLAQVDPAGCAGLAYPVRDAPPVDTVHSPGPERDGERPVIDLPPR
ncbi:MAG: hypothetical protein HUU18_09125 [Phycisphaerales bacterium]|nr:hypothetical protein [Phycisphaerales bacterium]